MTQTSTLTPNDVIRFLYNETSDLENVHITEALLYDSEMLTFYLDSLDLKKGFDKVVLAPPQRVVDAILDFSKNFRPEM